MRSCVTQTTSATPIYSTGAFRCEWDLVHIDKNSLHQTRKNIGSDVIWRLERRNTELLWASSSTTWNATELFHAYCPDHCICSKSICRFRALKYTVLWRCCQTSFRRRFAYPSTSLLLSQSPRAQNSCVFFGNERDSGLRHDGGSHTSKKCSRDSH